MALKLYLFGLISTFLLSSFLWVLLVISVNPFQAPTWIIFLFYLVFFMALVSIFSIINFYSKVRLGNREVIFSHLGPSLRQATFISFLLTAVLFFEQIKVLNWWVFGMLTIAIILIELSFRSRR